MNHGDNEKYSPWITFQVFLWAFFGLLPAFLLPLLFDYLVWRFKLDGYWNFIFFVIYMGYLLLVNYIGIKNYMKWTDNDFLRIKKPTNGEMQCS